MPGATIRVGVRIGRFRQRAMYRLPFPQARGAVYGGADKRIPETHLGADLDQPRRLGRLRRIGIDSEDLRGAPQQVHVTHCLCGRGEQKSLRLDRECLVLAKEALLDLARERLHVRKREPARELRHRQSARQLQQRERVTARFGDDAISDARVESPGHGGVQNGAGIAVAESSDDLFRKSRERVVDARLAHREHQTDGVRQETTRNEREYLRGQPIEPLRVVDDADERLLLRNFGQQAENGQTHQKSIGRGAGIQSERGAERVRLRSGETCQMLEHRRTELVQPGKRKLHLRLDPRRSSNAAVHCVSHEVVEQRGLAYSCVTAHDQHATLTGAHTFQHVVELRALAAPAE